MSRNGVAGSPGLTREANKEAQASGQTPASKKENDDASQLGELLAQDPVWKLIASGRETGKKGPHRPVTDQDANC